MAVGAAAAVVGDEDEADEEGDDWTPLASLLVGSP